MDDDLEPTTSGWTFGKIIGAILGVIGMLSFGSCTLIGPYFLHNPKKGWWVLMVEGAVMTLLCCWLVVAMFSSARKARDRSRFD